MSNIVQLYKQEEKKPWASDLDAKKFIVDVHMDFRELMGVDFKTAYFEDKDRELMFNLIPMALLGQQLCPNKLMGKQIMQMDLALVNVLAITKFNIKGNPLFSLFTQQEADDPEEYSNSVTAKFLDKMKGKVRPKRVEYDED